MRKTLLFAFAVVFSLGITAQEAKIPKINVKTLDGKSISANDFANDGKPFAICFWATWCKPCLMELNTIADLYEDWQKETGIKIYAVSLDDSRTVTRVKPLVNSSEWAYEVILDENSELKRAMGVNNPPHTFLCNGKGEIIWQHAGYAPGDEEHFFEAIRKAIVDSAISKQ
ncbi:MAG: TlpA family protein disulfide reductase [Bacteroidales bacterium]|jgi:alkyl hydroperoxide reductase subunit AhpC|nr:TlpA family protein disulfide reductase [Bacteroidales bacterium]